MKQTRKILVALLVLMTILMSLVVVAIPASAAGEDTEIAFKLGADGAASHVDGSSAASTYNETVNGYKLAITGGSKMYPSSRDAKGNGCIKLGTSSAVGGFQFVSKESIGYLCTTCTKFLFKSLPTRMVGEFSSAHSGCLASKSCNSRIR